MVVLTRNVDLSIGSVLGLSAFLSADLFGHHHGIPIALVFVVGRRDRDRVRCGERIPHGRRTRAEPGRHARDALHHPRHRHPRRRRRPGRRELAAERVHRDPAEDGGRASRSSRSSSQASSPSAPTTSARSARAASCTRSGRIPMPRGSPASRAGRRVFTAFVISGGIAGHRGRPLRRALRNDRLDRRQRLRAAGDRGGRRRRRRDLRRQRQRRRRGVRRAAPATRSSPRSTCSASRRSGTRRSPARCCSARSRSTAASRCSSPRHCANEGRTLAPELRERLPRAVRWEVGLVVRARRRDHLRDHRVVAVPDELATSSTSTSRSARSRSWRCR